MLATKRNKIINNNILEFEKILECVAENFFNKITESLCNCDELKLGEPYKYVNEYTKWKGKHEIF